MKDALAFVAAALTVHALIMLGWSWVALEWQNPLVWTDGERGVVMAVSPWLGILGPLTLTALRAKATGGSND